jgi:hypothetical protein
MAVFLDPIFDAAAGTLQSFARGALHYPHRSVLVLGPVHLKTQKLNPPASARMKSAKPYQACFLRGHCKTALFRPFGQDLEKLLSLLAVLKRAYKIICVSDDQCFTLAVSLDHFLEPQVKCIIQVHIS